MRSRSAIEIRDWAGSSFRRAPGAEDWWALDRVRVRSCGSRVRRADLPVDPDRPTIVFTGESVMAGYGLTWQESVPAQVEDILGTQCANVSVNGFATDQAYLRLLRAAALSSADGGGIAIHAHSV